MQNKLFYDIHTQGQQWKEGDKLKRKKNKDIDPTLGISNLINSLPLILALQKRGVYCVADAAKLDGNKWLEIKAVTTGVGEKAIRQAMYAINTYVKGYEV